MNLTARGIVIQTIKYSDSKLIVKILCSGLGYKSCMVRTSAQRKGSSQALFQPLRILEFETEHQEVSKFISVKNPRLATPLHNLSVDPVKISMVFFMNEVLSKTLADDYTNEELFQFLKNSIVLLDDAIDPKNFHLWWLMEITRYYGFYPSTTSGRFFNLKEGQFENLRPDHPYYLDTQLSEVLHSLLDLEWPQAQGIELHSSVRKNVLNALIDYLKIHLHNLREIKSLEVLHAVFH